MKKIILVLSITVCYISCFSQEIGTFKDQRDGKIYKTITIGTQTIMAENFAYKPSKGNYWAFDNKATNVTKYGYLYDWETAKAILPTGWHLPTKDEWKILCSNTGTKYSIVFENLIDSGNSGFKALLGGSRYPSKKFKGIDKSTEFWSSATDEDGNPWSFDFDLDFYSVSFGVKDPACGFSVRLFKD